jgi:hypothetical protein
MDRGLKVSRISQLKKITGKVIPQKWDNKCIKFNRPRKCPPPCLNYAINVKK